MMIIKVFVLLGLYSLSQSQNRFMPNLPLGEYRIVFDKTYHCDSTISLPMQYNIYFRKMSSNITELKGNITYLIPFDDTLNLDINFQSWGLTGGWIPNAYVLTTKKACSNTKKIFGNAWIEMAKSFNLSSLNCPITAGTYQTSGVDLKKLEDQNWPKVYFYGKYKVVFRLKNVKNKVVCCLVVEINLIRPWETPI